MERHHHHRWFRVRHVRLKLVVLVVAMMCLVETTRVSNQVKDQRSPETKRSLVALVQESSDFSADAKEHPSTGDEAKFEENNRPTPGEAQAEPSTSVFGKNGSGSKKTSVAEALSLLSKGHIPVEGRTRRVLLSAKQADKDEESLHALKRSNKRDAVSKKLSNFFLGKMRNTYRMRRNVSDGGKESLPTSSIAVDTSDKITKTTSNPSLSITTPNSQSTTFEIGSEGPPDLGPSQNPSQVPSEGSPEAPQEVPDPSHQTPSNQGVVTTAAPLPVTTSVHTTEEQLQTTSRADLELKSSFPDKQPATTRRTSAKQTEGKQPISKTSEPSSTKPIPAVSHTTTSSTPLPTSLLATNGSANESKIQEVKERTPDAVCANGNCHSALVPIKQWSNDAYWAFGSLLTILLILTVAVLYTGLWRKRNHMSNPISDVSCHAQASPSRKSKTDIKDLLKKKLRHIKNLNSSPLTSTSSSLSKQDTRQHNGSSARSSNGKAGNRFPHKYDRLPLLVGDENEEEEEFTKEWGPLSKEHCV